MLSVVITYVSLMRSFKVGRLSVPPVYDDVVYFAGAARWLSGAATHSVGANIYALLDQHAPFATLTAAIGLAWMPEGYVGPYAVNGFIVLVFLLGLARLVWYLPQLDIAACLVGAASVPMLGQTIAEARPDLPWGLAIGLAIGGIVRTSFLGRSYRSVFCLGLLCGLAVAVKPTAFAASIACILVAVGASVACEYLRSGGRSIRAAARQAAPRLLIFSFGMFGSAAAIIGPQFTKTVAYILKTMISDLDFWTTQEGVVDGLLHYSVGYEGHTALGNWLWVGLALFAARLALAYHRNRNGLGGALALLAIVFASYAIPSVSSVKSYFLGAIFYGTFIVAMVLNYAAIIGAIDSSYASGPPRAMNRRWLAAEVARLLPLVIVLSIFATPVLRGNIALATTFEENQIQDMRSATQRVWSDLQVQSSEMASRSQEKPGNGVIVSFTSPYPVNSSAIQLYAVQAHLKLEAREAYFYRTAGAATKALQASDIAVVTSSMPHNLPGPRMGNELIAIMDADPNMCLVDSMALLTTRTIRIYRHSDTGCGGRGQENP